jgi:hypothetical protein
VIAFFDGVRFAHVLTLLGLAIEPGTGLVVDVRLGVDPDLTITRSTGIGRGLRLISSRSRSGAGIFLVEETKHASCGGRRGGRGNGCTSRSGRGHR